MQSSMKLKKTARIWAENTCHDFDMSSMNGFRHSYVVFWSVGGVSVMWWWTIEISSRKVVQSLDWGGWRLGSGCPTAIFFWPSRDVWSSWSLAVIRALALLWVQFYLLLLCMSLTMNFDLDNLLTRSSRAWNCDNKNYHARTWKNGHTIAGKQSISPTSFYFIFLLNTNSTMI